MAYTAEISRTNPTCFFFLLDQSGSMGDPLAGSNGSKADELVTIINRLLQDLVIRCAKGEEIRDYYYVGALGYGMEVASPFLNALSQKSIHLISEIANNPFRVEDKIKKISDGAGGLVEQSIKFPIWFEPVARGGTPMCKALAEARNILEQWIQEHPHSFPPIVFNITDGEATDGDPLPLAQELQKLATSDGNLLLFNIHISSTPAQPVKYPSSSASLPDQYASLLFEMSSILPAYLREAAQESGYQVDQNSRGFVFNADLAELVQFLNIGTRPGNLR